MGTGIIDILELVKQVDGVTGLLKNTPTRDASPPLEIAFGGSIWCLKKRKH